MDLFVVPTIGFDLLYAFIIIRLDRRDLVWINVTTNPTAEYSAGQFLPVQCPIRRNETKIGFQPYEDYLRSYRRGLRHCGTGCFGPGTDKRFTAAQIRDQGYRCNTPLSANKDVRRSRPDEAAWVLRCKDATYRLRLVPDMAARVQRLK